MGIHSEYFEKGSLRRRIQDFQREKGFNKVNLTMTLFFLLFFALSVCAGIPYASSCTYEISVTDGTDFGPEGGVRWVHLDTQPGCAWSTISWSDWITTSVHETQTGSGGFSLIVDVNTGYESRTGYFDVGGQRFLITQSGKSPSCTYSINPTSASIGWRDEERTVSVTTQTNCPWRAVSNASWIVVREGSSGAGNGTVRYFVEPDWTITPRTGTMTIAEKTFTVTQQGIQVIEYTPASFSFTATQGGSNPPNQSLKISRAEGEGSMSWEVSDDATWLLLSPKSGSTTGEWDTVTVSVNISGLNSGHYEGNITVTSPGAQNSVIIHVTLDVQIAPKPSIGIIQQNSFNFVAAQGGSNPPSDTFAIYNSGSDTTTLSWRVSDDALWLTLSPTSGSSKGESDNITLSVRTSGLNAGTYNATITITAQGATNSPRTIPVNLTINPPPPPTIGLQQDSLSFAATQGGANPPSASLMIDNSGSGTLNWSVSDDASWITLSPTSGSSTGEVDRVTVSVNISGLNAGTYSATITVTGQGATNSPVSIPVTLTVNPAPQITIVCSPTSFSFTATQGGANPPNQTMGISKAGQEGSGSLSWGVSDDAQWITLSPTSGSSAGESDNVTLSVRISGLNAGQYSATVTVTGQGATNSPVSIPVTLTVSPAAQSTIGYQPSSYTFTATQGGANPQSSTLMIDNSGSGTLSWRVIDNAKWLTLSPTSGTSTGEIDRVTVSVNIRGLRAGTYNANIIIAAKGATNSPVTIPVTLTVSPAAPSTIGFQPSSYNFTATQGGANPQSSTLMIDNSGSGTLNWRVSDDASWLTLSPTSGSSTGEVDKVTVSVNISGLNAGTYNGTITITAQGATNSPVTIPVTLTVNSGQQATIGFQPTSFSFTANQGGVNPASKTLTVANLGSGSMGWSVSDNAQWLSLNPTQGTSAGEADDVTVSVNISGLNVGQYSATITITAQGATNSPVTIPVTLAVDAPQAQTAKSDNNSDLNYAESLVQQTSDGGYIEAGETDSSGPDGIDIWISKLDGDRNIQWQKTYGGSGDDWLSSIQETSDGGYIVVGETNALGLGQLCIWILKLDSSGNIQWQRAYDGSGHYWVYLIRWSPMGKPVVPD